MAKPSPTGLARPVQPPPFSAPQSLAGTTMDIEPSSKNVVSPPSSSPRSSATEPAGDSDDEVIRWARRRGVVSFFFFFVIAVAVALFWTLR